MSTSGSNCRTRGKALSARAGAFGDNARLTSVWGVTIALTPMTWIASGDTRRTPESAAINDHIRLRIESAVFHPVISDGVVKRR